MDENLFKEPKNSIGQTPEDQCYDAFREACEEAGLTIDEEGAVFQKGINSAIRMWEIIHHKKE